jgi:hypothetical protein
MRLRGAFHAHSTHSYDGRDTLKVLAGELRRRGFDFLLLTEHDDKLTPQTFARVVAEAAGLSAEDFLIVPGLEIRCWRREGEQWHIGAIGVRDWISRGPIPDVVKAIHEAGGLAIFLHPYKHSTSIEPAELYIFDGLEGWNGKFDGFYAPQGRTLNLFRRLEEFQPRPAFYCGHDLHGVDGIAPLALQVEADRLEVGAILGALRRGEFENQWRGKNVSSLRGPSLGQRIGLRAMRAAYRSYGWARRVPLLGKILGAVKQTAVSADPLDGI